MNKLLSIIEAYKDLIKGIEDKAKISTNRAYGGIIRAGKGKLVESIGKNLIEIAWEELNMPLENLKFSNKRVKIPINKNYLERIKNIEVRKFIEENIDKYFYPLKVDIQVYVKNKFKIAIECKSYTENAMLKRILVDFTLLKNLYPDLKFVLLQLESQLGGDFSSMVVAKYGSPSTHTILSYFDINIHIITLLKGERKVDKPIHKRDYYKPLQIDSLKEAVEVFKFLLS
ncbi:MAG TPA: restriction endonuclease [bacterium]|nr:restriction endonuclease [bacterium]